MIRHYGKIVGIETYRTTDGKEFYDFDEAEKHQDELDVNEIANSIVKNFSKQLGELIKPYLDDGSLFRK